MRIAVVEDNVTLADGIAKALSSEGHGVDQLHDGQDAISFLSQEIVDLIILDINLPTQSGLDVLSKIRKSGFHTPVLLLTARSNLDDKVKGFDLGADDYLTKPFELEELQVRVRALLRRGGSNAKNQIDYGYISYNQQSRQLLIKDKEIKLPRRELMLAELFIKRKEHVFSKQQILEHLYGTGADVEEGAVELYISRLRKKLIGAGVEIKTLRGLGYCMRESENNN